MSGGSGSNQYARYAEVKASTGVSSIMEAERMAIADWLVVVRVVMNDMKECRVSSPVVSCEHRQKVVTDGNGYA